MTPKYREILIASNNQGKIEEITKLLDNIGVRAISPLTFKLAEPDENGSSFEQNSLIKAQYYASQTQLPSLADDSGICIEALDNQPGIHSARYAINPKTQKRDFDFAFQKIYDELEKKGIKDFSQAQAHFVCDLCFFDSKTNFYKNFCGKITGTISPKPLGSNGFGYDPIFIKEGFNQTFGEISLTKKEQISHRALAFEKFISWLIAK